MSGWLGYIATAGFLAGLAGGVHCAAMCGPILAACAGSRGAALGRWQAALAYNTGRITSYGVAGTLAGAFGAGAFAIRGGTSAASALALLSGTAMILLALHVAGYTPVSRRLEAAGSLIWRHVQPYSRRVLPADTFTRAFSLGAIWGWVPCGMVYAALVLAAATADPIEGALVMFAFGAGTLPNVLGITFAAARLRDAFRYKRVRLFTASVLAGFGAFAFTFVVHAHPYTLGELICRLVPAAAPLIQ